MREVLRARHMPLGGMSRQCPGVRCAHRLGAAVMGPWVGRLELRAVNCALSITTEMFERDGRGGSVQGRVIIPCRQSRTYTARGLVS